MLRSVIPAARTAVFASVRPVPRATPVRQMSALKSVYPMFMDSNMKYLTFIVAGCIAIEVVYGKLTDSIWEGMNQGKLAAHVDFSSWEEKDEEEE